MVTKLKPHGADVSHHQDNLNLKQARAAGLLFLYHKATEGTTVKDAEYNMRRVAAKAAGLPFGAYHFARPDGADAVAEARAFIEFADPKAGDLVPVLDLEVAGNNEAWAKAFMAEVVKLLKARKLIGNPMHYGPDDFGPDYKHLRWVPRYNNTNTPPTIRWDIWQYSNGQYGVPNVFPGLGHVDLNVMQPTLKLSDFTLTAVGAKPDEPKPAPHELLNFTHISMQFSDTPLQVHQDAAKIFKRGYDIITGTEANPGTDVRITLKQEAETHGYKFHADKASDAWIAVHRSLGTAHWETGVDPVIGTYSQEGSTLKFGAKGVTWVTFLSNDFGPIGVMAAHYLTQGKKAGPESIHGKADHFKLNQKLATAIGKRADIMAKGVGLALYGGDQNIVDRDADTFMGKTKMTSTWDELGKYENTGHGNIDVIATHDADRRVTAKATRVLPDSKLQLHTDHFVVEAVLDIVKLVEREFPSNPK